MNIRHIPAVAALLAGALAVPHPTRAAESYDNCTGYIDTLPATISTGGTWCLRKDLSTNIGNGSAIDVVADDVAIDCNQFKIGGLAAGNGSKAIGISAPNPEFSSDVRKNVTIRHCNIRGFYTGIHLSGSGHLVEDNRLDNNLYTGIVIGRSVDYEAGGHNLVRRNAVYDTGGATYGIRSIGMFGTADFIDNVIDGVFADATSASLFGIVSLGTGTQVSRNRIGGLDPGAGAAFGIVTWDHEAGITGYNQTIAENRISSVQPDVDATGAGIYSGDNDGGLTDTNFCSGNTIGRFATKQLSGCADDGGNTTL